MCFQKVRYGGRISAQPKQQPILMFSNGLISVLPGPQMDIKPFETIGIDFSLAEPKLNPYCTTRFNGANLKADFFFWFRVPSQRT